MQPAPRGRFAPSPTGRLHLGNARTALLAWLWARAEGGTFVLRMEDLDPDRSRREHEAGQLADLRWLGLDWDEGPDVGGPHGPYRQSERGDWYRAALDRLQTFPCTCTRKELRLASSAPLGDEPVYPGTCREHGPRPGRPEAIRWCTPPGEITVLDRVQGTLRQEPRRHIGDFLLRRSDGAFAYQLAVVVDDAAMGVTQVLRGRDLLASTCRQVLLQGVLGLARPAYAHAPLLLGQAGHKLSKRDGAPDLAQLRAAKVNPRRIVHWLAQSCGLVPPGDGASSPAELLARFDLARIAKQDTPLAAMRPLPATS